MFLSPPAYFLWPPDADGMLGFPVQKLYSVSESQSWGQEYIEGGRDGSISIRPVKVDRVLKDGDKNL